MKVIEINKKDWEAAKKAILVEIPGYPEYAAESRAAKAGLATPNVKLFGGDKEAGWVFTTHAAATPENVLSHFNARRFPITLDNVQYTEKNGVVYSHASGGNVSRSLWAKGKKVNTIITGKVLVILC